jgi:DNA-binding NtrC family response regulator
LSQALAAGRELLKWFCIFPLYAVPARLSNHLDAETGLFQDTMVSSMTRPTAKQPKVLLLETARRSASTISILVKADFEVISVRNPNEAWATLEARDDVDVLLADISSPAGGVELGRYIHGRWPGVGLVLTSEQVRHLRPDEVPGNGCFLPHPIPPDTLLDEIRMATRRP